MHQLYILAAVDFEFAPLKQLCAQYSLPVHFHTVGIGAISAAAESSRLRECLAGKDILFIGTCGNFADFNAPELIAIESVEWSCLGERMGLAYKVERTMPEIELDAPTNTELRRATALCAASISLTAELPLAYNPARYVENIELYSVASQLRPVSHSFRALLCTTNQIGRNAHQQWCANFQTAAQITSQYIFEQIEKSEN